MDKEYYNRDTIDAKLSEAKAQIADTHSLIISFKEQYTDDMIGVKDQLAYTNGKVKSLTKVLLIVASVCGTLLITNGSRLAEFIMQIIK